MLMFKPIRQRDASEFLPAALEILDTPPAPTARAVQWLLVAFAIVAISWATFGQVNEVASASGQIIPGSRVKLIQPIENGVVRAIHVQDGQQVRAGEVLVELDATDAGAAAESVRSDLSKARLDAAIAKALLSEEPVVAFQLPQDVSGPLAGAARSQLEGEVEKLRASLAMVDADIAEQQAAKIGFGQQQQAAVQATPLIEKRLAGLELLESKDLVKLPDLIAVKQQKLENQSTVQTLGSSILQATARIESKTKRRQEIISNARADALERQANALKQIATLEQQLRREERRKEDRQLLAPVEGTVVGLSVFTVGGVVTTKDVLMRIVPRDATLEAEVTVLNKDIGFVQKGMSVELKLETFPFTRYGLVRGVVKQVWRDAIQDEKQGLVYKAEIELREKEILVGLRFIPLQPGMAVQAEIMTGRRPVIDYFLSPILKYRDESLRER